MADDNVYRKLQQHLDKMPVPFPATESGVEIRILKHLFTPDDARVALALSMIPEPVAVIHRRLRRDGMTREALAEQLARLSDAGLIMGVPSSRGPLYGKTVFVIGFYEAQLNRLTPEFERDVLQYFEEAFHTALMATTRTPQMRVVPINRDVPVPDRAIGRYDDIATIVRKSDGPFAAMNCICKQGKEVLGETCRQTTNHEHCLSLGPAARVIIERGKGRLISREEMLSLLEQADHLGLVLQPQNTENPLFVCCCCGCCCGVLTTAKKLPEPAKFFSTNYSAHVDDERCQACGTCTPRCPMDAVSLVAPRVQEGDTVARAFRPPDQTGLESDATSTDGESAFVDEQRCIGCGLCVSTCPSGAMQLVHHPTERVPPKNTRALYMQMFRERYGAIGVVKTMGRKVLGLRT